MGSEMCIRDRPTSGPKGSGQTWEYWGRIVTVLQRSAHAYYHFVAECLPKLLLVQTELAEHPDAAILVDESYGGGAWTREFFALLGVPSSQLVVRTPGKVYIADTVHMVCSGRAPCPAPPATALCRHCWTSADCAYALPCLGCLMAEG